MKKTKRSNKANKSVAVKQVVKEVINKERERVLYSFDTKKTSIKAEFKSNVCIIAKADVIELLKRLNDLSSFYAYCNKDIKLLRKLECDAQAKKQMLCINTKYDSRKKLHALILQLSLTSLKQYAKAKASAKNKTSAKAKAVKK